ncbi:hypothetical protein [Bacillus clarus]|uniref:Uncharacterized protein n=1 Tax=Bacillus clarus TaxID=2338372 RepID=A0A090YAR5_9BACI|nr:hypothetical protein [Bacillus clarus]KFM95544.1 hypothetical protein DJ93_5398 [Bacillus clarus]
MDILLDLLRDTAKILFTVFITAYANEFVKKAVINVKEPPPKPASKRAVLKEKERNKLKEPTTLR